MIIYTLKKVERKVQRGRRRKAQRYYIYGNMFKEMHEKNQKGRYI